MTSSPGHKKWPNHHIVEEHPRSRVEVIFDGIKIAESTSVIKVVEDNHPLRYYLPREDVDMNALERSDTTTECPFKGIANYFSITIGKHRIDDAVWTYEDPYEEHQGLRNRVAFYDDKSDLQLKVA